MGRLRGLLVGAVLGAAAMAGTAVAASPTPLAIGDAAFWSGPGAGAAACGTGCWEYALDVRARGRLRVAIDHPRVGDTFTVDVISPGGSQNTFGTGEGLYSAERSLTGAGTGVWKVRVTATDVLDARFRMRAKLEGPAPPRPAQRAPILPNMQIQPPFQFNFSFPVTDGGAITAQQGDRPIGIPLPLGLLACHVEELAQGNARCLRMSFGVRNTGQGPMYFSYAYEGSTADQTLYQHVYWSDGTTSDRVAGIARYHQTHLHYHQHEAVALQLFAVTDPARGALVAAGAEKRKGFHHREELLREWRRFYPVWQPYGFGLASGWADYYEWDRPDNYLDFGLNGDGRYVVRMTADPGNVVLESNEVDNRGYTYIEVAGNEIRALESGRGLDPWDRCKIVMPIGTEPDPAGAATNARPADCPPDTVWPEEPAAAKKKAAKKKKAKKRSCPKAKKKRSRKASAAKARCPKRRK